MTMYLTTLKVSLRRFVFPLVVLRNLEYYQNLNTNKYAFVACYLMWLLFYVS